MADYDSGYRALEALAEVEERGSRNEASTRLHLIDTLLFDCLAWPKGDAVLEESFAGDYADYALGRPSRRLIVEAKREGHYFQLPPDLQARDCAIRALEQRSPDFSAAFRQALGYCLARGVPYGVVANGHQLVAFLASRADGVPPDRGRALIFYSLDDMLAAFDALWDALSQPAVLRGELARRLGASPAPLPPSKLLTELSPYPGYKQRNNMQVNLQNMGDIVLTELANKPVDEEEFLRACYCTSGALSQYALLSAEYLRSRYDDISGALAGQVTPAARAGGVAKELTPDVHAAAKGSRPIILLGDVGVGKTMFIRHFVSIDARDLISASIILHVDFLEGPALSTDVEGYVLDRIEETLVESYDIDILENKFVRGVYNKDLRRFERSVAKTLKRSDPSEYERRELDFLLERTQKRSPHLRASLNQVAATSRRLIVLILDNIDQREEWFQEKVFTIAESIARTWPCAVFLSMRPETFYESQRQGSLTAYQPRVFTIAPPRVELVIRRRLAYAEQAAKEGHLAGLGGVGVDVPTLQAYLATIRQSLEWNESLSELVDNLSGGNVRLGLSFVNAFVGSGHVDTSKILRSLEARGRYVIPVHEFLRAIIYGDHIHYSPTASVVANVFDVSTTDGREHFLLPSICRFLEQAGATEGGGSVVDAARVYEYGQALGFSAGQVGYALERATRHRLVHVLPTGVDGAQRLRGTTVGAYTVRRLMQEFAYVDGVVVDTPILGSQDRFAIGDARTIEERLDRGERFVAYLDGQWPGEEAVGGAFDWTPVSERLRENMEYIRRAAATVARRDGAD